MVQAVDRRRCGMGFGPVQDREHPLALASPAELGVGDGRQQDDLPVIRVSVPQRGELDQSRKWLVGLEVEAGEEDPRRLELGIQGQDLLQRFAYGAQRGPGREAGVQLLQEVPGPAT